MNRYIPATDAHSMQKTAPAIVQLVNYLNQIRSYHAQGRIEDAFGLEELKATVKRLHNHLDSLAADLTNFEASLYSLPESDKKGE